MRNFFSIKRFVEFRPSKIQKQKSGVFHKEVIHLHRRPWALPVGLYLVKERLNPKRDIEKDKPQKLPSPGGREAVKKSGLQVG